MKKKFQEEKKFQFLTPISFKEYPFMQWKYSIVYIIKLSHLNLV